MDTQYYSPGKNSEVLDNSLLFCGSMDWLPNEDAIHFFIDEIFPLLRDEEPRISLTVVGRNPSPGLKNKVNRHSEINLTGWVEDTRPYFKKSFLYIVPIRIGGGTRMKIFEAMAMGMVVISTSVGAEGLPVTDGENIFIEDDPVRFARRIKELLSKRGESTLIGQKARQFVESNFSWKTVADGFSRICKEAAREK
ncbi:MAG: glycosyltransferase [Nitrospinota bacterium]